MGDDIERRSQAILRMPVDKVAVSLVLHDGERADVLLFLPPGEDLARLVSAGEPFLPVTRKGKFVLIARAAIAAVGVAPVAIDDALPHERQAASIKLRSGTVLAGELRWPSSAGRARTADCLNSEGAYVEVHSASATYYVLKAHIATVEET